MVPYRSLKNWEPVPRVVKWFNLRRKKSAYINLPMEFILDEESGARALGPSVVPYLLRHLWPSFWGHIAMRASFLLDPLFVRSSDPNFYGFPIHLDCSTYGRLGFASSMIVVIEERVPLYLRQQTAPLSSGKDPNPKMLQRNLLSKWNQGADAPLLQKWGGGGDGW